MDNLGQVNLFFIITTVAVIVFSIITAFILFQILKIITAIRRLMEKFELGSEKVGQDLSNLRSFMLQGGFAVQLLKLFFSKKRRSKDED